MTMLPFGQIAPISRRAVAYVIDAAIAAGLGVVLAGLLVTFASLAGSPEGTLGVLLIGGPVLFALLLGWYLVYTFMQSGTGSIGMRAQGVRLVDAADGMTIGFWRALLRNIVFSLAGSIVVGYFTPLFDGTGRYQGWHDKVAKSLVIDTRAATAGAPTPPPQTTAVPVPGYPHVPAAGGAQPAPFGAPPVPGAPDGAFPPAPQYPQQAPFGGLATPPAPGAYGVAPAVPAPAPAGPAFGGAPAQPEPPAQPVFPDRPAAPSAPLTDALDETIVPPRPPLPVTPEPAPPAPADASLIAFVPGITQDAPVRPSIPAPAEQLPPAPAAPAAPASAPAPAPTVPDVVREDDDVEQTRISVPGHRLVFTWDDGTRVSVSRRTVFGRNPAAEDGAVVVPVRDETLSLSKTHFEAAAEATGGWILDRHSTNGTTLVRDGVQIECPAGERVPIKLGDVISIGDRVITVGGYA